MKKKLTNMKNKANLLNKDLDRIVKINKGNSQENPDMNQLKLLIGFLILINIVGFIFYWFN